MYIQLLNGRNDDNIVVLLAVFSRHSFAASVIILRACGHIILLHREQKNRLWKKNIIHACAPHFIDIHWQRTKYKSYILCLAIAKCDIIIHFFFSFSSFGLIHSRGFLHDFTQIWKLNYNRKYTFKWSNHTHWNLKSRNGNIHLNFLIQ